MNCHLHVKSQSPLLADLRESWNSDRPVRWKQIHKLPDYAYFNHAVHIQRGVSCHSCHGKVNEMAGWHWHCTVITSPIPKNCRAASAHYTSPPIC